MSNSTSGPSSQQDDSELDLGQIFGILWDGKWKILVVCFLAACISAFIALNTPPVYQANALLQLEERAGQNPFPGGLEDFGGNAPQSVTEIEIIKSRLVLGQAVAEQNLDWVSYPQKLPVFGHILSKFGLFGYSPEFLLPYAQADEKIELSFLQVPPEWLNLPLILTKTPQGYDLLLPDTRTVSGQVDTLLIDEQSGFSLLVSQLVGQTGRKFEIFQRSEAAAIFHLRSSLAVSEHGRKSGILNFTFNSGNKTDAQRALRAIVNSYLRQNISRNSAEAENSLQFIEARIPEVRTIVDNAEAKLKELQSERNTLDLSFETLSLLEQMTQLETELAALATAEEEIKRKYTPNHPVYKDLLVQKQSLESRLAALKEKSLDLPQTQREVYDITQELELARETYSKLLIRAQELRVVKASTIGNVRVIDQAQTAASPIAPKKSRTVVLGTLIGLLIGAGMAFISGILRTGITKSSEIEELQLPVFAVVNKVAEKKPTKINGVEKWSLIAVDDPTDIAVEAFRSLRTSLHFGMLDSASKTLAITGASPEIGKSFCSANLAAVSAQAGQRVCLIDADLRRGQMRKYFGLPKSQIGLSEYLAEEKTLDEVLIPSNISGLSTITTGTYPPNPSELLMRPMFSTLLANLAKSFDLIIVDCPPVLAVTDPIVISKHAGMTLAVVRYGKTTQREVQAIMRDFEVAGETFSGAIFNAYERPKRQSYDSYDYRYAYEKRS
nr:polysaccharide biosynthesis tyrosine autokinase [uncultured Shimia sp.]